MLGAGAEIDYISILHDVFLALQAQQSFFAGGSKCTAVHQIIIAHYFCTNKAALKIGVNLSGCLRRFHAAR